MIAWAITVLIQGEFKFAHIHFIQNPFPLRRSACASHNQFVIAQSSNHIHVEHGDYLFERNDGIFHKIVRTEHTQLFSSKRNEQEISRQLIFAACKESRELK